jgi:hypothetical protein
MACLKGDLRRYITERFPSHEMSLPLTHICNHARILHCLNEVMNPSRVFQYSARPSNATGNIDSIRCYKRKSSSNITWSESSCQHPTPSALHTRSLKIPPVKLLPTAYPIPCSVSTIAFRAHNNMDHNLLSPLAVFTSTRP